MSKWWVQDNNGQGWRDSVGFGTMIEATEWYKEMIRNPIWLNEGKRDWRVVMRVDTVIAHRG